MKKNTSFFILTGVLFVLSVILFNVNPTVVGAKETCNVVTIEAKSDLSPSVMKVSPGDCVIWINWTGTAGAQVENNEVSLSFKEGEKCIQATMPAPVFKMEESSGCFVAQWLKYGQTVSLTFTKPGTYPYEVKSRVGAALTGQIVVK